MNVSIRSGRTGEIAMRRIMVSGLTTSFSAEWVASRLVEAGVDGHVRGDDNASDHAPAWIKLGR